MLDIKQSKNINSILTGVVAIYPDKGGEIIPGIVANVDEIPVIILENWGAISSEFVVYPQEAKAPNPTDKTMHTIIGIGVERNPAAMRKNIWQINAKLLKYIRTWVTEKKFFFKIQSAMNPEMKTKIM